MDNPPQAREIVGVLLLVLQPKHAGEHGGNELGVGDPVPFDGLETSRWLERLHDHAGGAEPMHRHRVDKRRGVVQRSRGEVDRVSVDSHPGDVPCQQHRGRGRIAHRRGGQDLAHALGCSGGS